MAFPKAHYIACAQNKHDADLAIVISDTTGGNVFADLPESLAQAKNIDPRVGEQPSLVKTSALGYTRCLFVKSPSTHGDFDDIRVYFELGKNIASYLRDLKAIKPTVFLDLTKSSGEKLSCPEHALQVIYLGMCQYLWEPLEAREFFGEDIEQVDGIYLHGLDAHAIEHVNAIEKGKRVARDLCGTEPERMAPPKFAEYCVSTFKDTIVSCSVISDTNEIAKQYPLLFAVARASIEVKRHQPRIIRLTYVGEGPIKQCLYFAGKGITYDTGGADLKVNGHMAGMSRDKGGAASVVGLMQSIALLKPKGVKIIAEIGAVRNSIGAEAYVPDEIITSHAGVRVRVGNTDAEGRMVLADLLSHLKDDALGDTSIRCEQAGSQRVTSELFSVATLTGHAAMSFGPYTALVENVPAKQKQTAQRLCAAGEKWADPCEQSLLRKEDFNFVKPTTNADDVLSSNNKASVATPRGHQFPAAFLLIASGLQRHDSQSEQPLAFTHVDIAGSSVENMDWQHGKPTAAGLSALLMGLIKL